MADILIRNLTPNTIEFWKRRAAKHRRSLQAEIGWVLEQIEREAENNTIDANPEEARRERFLERMAEWDRYFGDQEFPNSADLIREERDRSYGREF